MKRNPKIQLTSWWVVALMATTHLSGPTDAWAQAARRPSAAAPSAQTGGTGGGAAATPPPRGNRAENNCGLSKEKAAEIVEAATTASTDAAEAVAVAEATRTISWVALVVALLALVVSLFTRQRVNRLTERLAAIPAAKNPPRRP